MSDLRMLTRTDRARQVLGQDVTEANLTRFLRGLPGVDTVGAQARAAHFASRSLKTETKKRGLDLAIGLMDLTTLEGADTPGKVRSLVAKAIRPDPTDPSCPSVAAVCVYSDMVPHAVEALSAHRFHPDRGGVKVASVATAFPSGRSSLRVKIADTEDAVAAGADEIDMVIDRAAFLSGRWGEVFEQIVAIKNICQRPDGNHAHLKVIL